jgi:hypothetical protein
VPQAVKLPSGVYRLQPRIGATVHSPENAQTKIILKMAPPYVIGLAERPLAITWYRSNEIIVMFQIEAQPHMEPNIPYTWQKRGPRTQVSCQEFTIIGGPMVNIMKKSEKARFTISRLDGVLNDLVVQNM